MYFIHDLNDIFLLKTQVIGQHAVSFKLLLNDAPAAVRTIFLDSVCRLGWANSMWGDDNLASKHIYPGHQHKAVSKACVSRLQVIEESMLIHLKRLIHTFEAQPAYFKKKRDNTSMDQMSEKAALVYHAGQDIWLSCSVSHRLIVQDLKSQLLIRSVTH